MSCSWHHLTANVVFVGVASHSWLHVLVIYLEVRFALNLNLHWSQRFACNIYTRYTSFCRGAMISWYTVKLWCSDKLQKAWCADLLCLISLNHVLTLPLRWHYLCYISFFPSLFFHQFMWQNLVDTINVMRWYTYVTKPIPNRNICGLEFRDGFRRHISL